MALAHLGRRWARRSQDLNIVKNSHSRTSPLQRWNIRMHSRQSMTSEMKNREPNTGSLIRKATLHFWQPRAAGFSYLNHGPGTYLRLAPAADFCRAVARCGRGPLRISLAIALSWISGCGSSAPRVQKVETHARASAQAVVHTPVCSFGTPSDTVPMVAISDINAHTTEFVDRLVRVRGKLALLFEWSHICADKACIDIGILPSGYELGDSACHGEWVELEGIVVIGASGRGGKVRPSIVRLSSVRRVDPTPAQP